MEDKNKWDLFKEILKDTDTLTISVTILIAILGWIIAIWLQNRNIKKQHKIKIRYEIYKDFVNLHKKTQDEISKLSVVLPPLISMDSSMIPFKLGLKKEYKGVFIAYSESECIFEGGKKWTSFTQDHFKHYFNFTERFINLMYVFEDWESALQPLLSVKNTLNNEIMIKNQEIYKDLSELSSYPSKHTNDWRNWDKNEIKKISKNITENTHIIGTLISDFMVLIHNELLSTYFGHKRPTRMTLDSKFKVLTKKGIVENVNHKLVLKMEKWKIRFSEIVASEFTKIDHTSEEGKRLKCLSEGLCPDCKGDILIIDSHDNSKMVSFVYACGHSYVFKN